MIARIHDEEPFTHHILVDIEIDTYGIDTDTGNQHIGTPTHIEV